jgi:predicted RNA polymerase sigma factor
MQVAFSETKLNRAAADEMVNGAACTLQLLDELERDSAVSDHHTVPSVRARLPRARFSVMRGVRLGIYPRALPPHRETYLARGPT